MRFVAPAILVILIAFAGCLGGAQNQPEPQPHPGQYFSGVIARIEQGKITVVRTVLGKEDATRTFLVTGETRTEGKPKVKARVTVRFVAGDDGDRAVHILVRAAARK